MGYKNYRERGICPSCGKPVEQGWSRCMPCRVKGNTKAREVVRQRIAEGKCQTCGKPCDRYPKILCSVCYQKHSDNFKKNHRKAKYEALTHYGGICVCCGESEFGFLTIDHINNDGKQHRLTAGHLIFEWLKRNNYPSSGYQVLCMNCNWAKSLYGECPHQKSKHIEGGGKLTRAK